jgi:hypothetical protein
VLFVVGLVGIVGCEDDKKQRLIAQTAGEAGAMPSTTTTTTVAAPAATPSGVASSAPDAADDMKRFDPKHKCPTGQTHFYLEGDFCRRKCFTNADCGKGERCSMIDYPFVLDGGTAGRAKFCEGT